MAKEKFERNKPHVNVGTIRNFMLPEPPQDEQILIAEYVDQQATKYDSLIEVCTNSIALLGERRSALISAAVTGQIDVTRMTNREVAE